MLSTSVVSAFSYGVVRRPSSSSGFSPVYVHPSDTTGMLMLGKMSVGVRRMMTGLKRRIRSARTMNVYGRFRAVFTIHIESSEAQSGQTYHYVKRSIDWTHQSAERFRCISGDRNRKNR